VSDVVARLLRDKGWHEEVSVGGVIGRWREVVGDQVADHCTPETFEDKVLVVRADSTAWATQVRLLVPTLMRRLDEEVGEGVVERVSVLGPAGPSFRRGRRPVRGPGPGDTFGRPGWWSMWRNLWTTWGRAQARRPGGRDFPRISGRLGGCPRVSIRVRGEPCDRPDRAGRRLLGPRWSPGGARHRPAAGTPVPVPVLR